MCDETEGDEDLLSEGAGRTAAGALLPSNNRKEGGAGKRLSLEDLQVHCKGIRGCWHEASVQGCRLTMCSSAGSLFMLRALSAPARGAKGGAGPAVLSRWDIGPACACIWLHNEAGRGVPMLCSVPTSVRMRRLA